MIKLKVIYIVFLLTCLPAILHAQHAEIIKFPRLAEIIDQKNDTTYIVNFWATWCKPCIEELPYFLESERELSGKNYKFIFISLDFKRDSIKLNNWLQKRKMYSTVYLLDEPDYNSWIEKIDKKWEGNIPATLIYNSRNNYRAFFPHEFTREELKKLLKIP